MFQVLIASGPQARPGLHRFVLSIGVHVGLIGTAAALARDPSAPTPTPPSGPIGSQATPRPSGPLAPTWEPKIGLPDLDPVVLPAMVPGVAGLLRDATLTTGPEPGLSVGSASVRTPELLTADAVDYSADPAT